MDKLTLTLDPRLGLDADDLVAAWNAEPTLHAKAEASYRRPAHGTFHDSTLVQILLDYTVSVGGGITTGLVLDLILRRLTAKGKDTPVEIIERELPGGERVLFARPKDS
jgi:hypothetical protein